MKLLCLVKFVPDTEQFEYDYKTDRINREKSTLILNPDDKSALGWALEQKELDPSIEVEVVSMGPEKIEEELKDFIRLGADRATLLSDRAFMGSDSLATSRILGTYLSQTTYDLLLTGTHTLDGGTGHIGPQIAEFLQLDQFSNIQAIHDLTADYVVADAFLDERCYQVKLQLPCVLSVTHQLNARLGFVRYENIGKPVDDQFTLVTNDTLQLPKEQIGRKGSPTVVRKNQVIKRHATTQKVVKADEEGVNEVIRFLKEKGYVSCSEHSF